jgi:sulfate adenylyltransferase
LVDEQDYPLAIFYPESWYETDLEKECNQVYGTTDLSHPYVSYLKRGCYRYGIGGRLEHCDQPVRCIKKDRENERTPTEMKEWIKEQGWENVIVFQTRNPLHRSHVEMIIKCWSRMSKNTLLWIHPVIGVTQEDDVVDSVRMKCYEEVIKEYPEEIPIYLSTLPLSMRMAGPREAVLHAIIRSNYGATDFMVGRDHAAPSHPKGLYGMYDAHKLLEKVKDRLSIRIVLMEKLVYIPEDNTYIEESVANQTGRHYMELSGTELRDKLKNNQEIPMWYTYPSVARILQTAYPKRGDCIYLVGLSGSGKTTIGRALEDIIKREISRNVTLLDGDELRSRWKYPLGFSRQDRSLQTRIMGSISSEVVKHGGICIVCNIAPYEDDRMANRKLISTCGKYIQVYLKTPIEECERRDKKRLYEKAKRGEIQLTGVNDPFEEPNESDIILDGRRPIYELVDSVLDICDIYGS